MNTKTVRSRIINPKETMSPFNMACSPPFVSYDELQKITNKQLLIELEKMYDEFLESECQMLLLLCENIDLVIDIRNQIHQRIKKLNRFRFYNLHN